LKMGLFLFATIFFILIANTNFRDRISLGIQQFLAFEGVADFSSIGQRLYFWEITWKYIQQKLWLGHGPGSYRLLSEAAFNDPTMCRVGCLHPHQQFLLFWLEFGFVGLMIFVLFISSVIVGYFRHPNFHPLAFPVLIVFILCCLVDTPFWYHGFVFLFIPLIGLVAAQPLNE
jgi:O-antigen ligase